MPSGSAAIFSLWLAACSSKPITVSPSVLFSLRVCQLQKIKRKDDSETAGRLFTTETQRHREMGLKKTLANHKSKPVW